MATKQAHLAFWDRSYLQLLLEWEQHGFHEVRIHVNAVNEAVRLLSEAIPPEAAVALARAAAEAVDRMLEGISPELAAAIEAAGHPRILRRALHWQHHLDQIEMTLSARS